MEGQNQGEKIRCAAILMIKQTHLLFLLQNFDLALELLWSNWPLKKGQQNKMSVTPNLFYKNKLVTKTKLRIRSSTSSITESIKS